MHGCGDETVLLFRVGLDTDARVCFRGPVTEAAVRKLIVLLEASIDCFPADVGKAETAEGLGVDALVGR